MSVEQPNSSEPIQSKQSSDSRVYDGTFLATFLANTFLMAASSLLFRYSDFVESHGGDELRLGWIVGIGSVGALILRAFQAVLIDRVGIRLVWTVSLSIFIFGALWHTQIETITSWQVFAARVMLTSGLAGSLGSWLTFASLRAPQHRVAEVIGVVGASGFVGMAIGPLVGDWLLADGERSVNSVSAMFFVAALFAACSLVCAWVANRPGQLTNYDSEKLKMGKRLSSWFIIKKHRPGFLLIVAIAMGVGGSIPSTFLRPFTESIGISSIGMYFLVYNFTAFTCRIVFRRASHRVGTTMMIIIGLTAMGLSMPLYLLAATPTLLFVPAIAAGVSHCFLFPAVMSRGVADFPIEYRGLAMNVMFSMYDIGLIFGAPALGLLLSFAREADLPPYVVMFLCLGTLVAAIGIIFTFLERRRRCPVNSIAAEKISTTKRT